MQKYIWCVYFIIKKPHNFSQAYIWCINKLQKYIWCIIIMQNILISINFPRGAEADRQLRRRLHLSFIHSADMYCRLLIYHLGFCFVLLLRINCNPNTWVFSPTRVLFAASVDVYTSRCPLLG